MDEASNGTGLAYIVQDRLQINTLQTKIYIVIYIYIYIFIYIGRAQMTGVLVCDSTLNFNNNDNSQTSEEH